MKPKEKVASWPKCESHGLKKKKFMKTIKTVITETSDMAGSAKSWKQYPPPSLSHACWESLISVVRDTGCQPKRDAWDSEH